MKTLDFGRSRRDLVPAEGVLPFIVLKCAAIVARRWYGFLVEDMLRRVAEGRLMRESIHGSVEEKGIYSKGWGIGMVR